MIFPPDPANEAHSFHLHGNTFWVVKSNATDISNTVNPIRRDVAGTASGGMILRFTTDKPGSWFFHCPIFYHFVAGLGSVIVGGPEEIHHIPQRAGTRFARPPMRSPRMSNGKEV
ncbi:Cupredoxin [Mycena olivaceomarginata]|nr:Cupredoxin [Mycena olivaceomarginata]